MHTRVTIRRPNKPRSERVDDLLKQIFFHDGTLLTLYNPDDKGYAPVATPATAKALPMGDVVTSLPPGCKPKTINGVMYYHDGTNYFRAVFQGSSLVYVTVSPA
jgi:hypothetical protein